VITPDQAVKQISELLANVIEEEIARNVVFSPRAEWTHADDGTPTVELIYNDGRRSRIELRCESSRKVLRYWVELVKLDREVRP